jgi:hypothetical protein
VRVRVCLRACARGRVREGVCCARAYGFGRALVYARVRARAGGRVNVVCGCCVRECGCGRGRASVRLRACACGDLEVVRCVRDLGSIEQ